MIKPTFLNIFCAFFKIGVILLGGGYVIVPIMKKELIEKRQWLTDDEICDYYCISQCLSGIIAINMSIIVGYKLLKTKGALASILGMSLSPIVSIVLVAKFLGAIIGIPFIDGIFWGINLSVIILIYLTLKDMWTKSISDGFCAFWFVLILFLSVIKISAAILIVFSILIGIAIQFIKDKINA